MEEGASGGGDLFCYYILFYLVFLCRAHLALLAKQAHLAVQEMMVIKVQLVPKVLKDLL